MAEVSVKDASDRLGVSEQYVLRMLSSGRLVGRRDGRAWRVTESSLGTLAASRTPARSRARRRAAEAPSAAAAPQALVAADDAAKVAPGTPRGAAAPARPMLQDRAVHPEPELAQSGSQAVVGVPGTVVVPAETWRGLVAERDRLRAAVGHLSSVVAELAGAAHT